MPRGQRPSHSNSFIKGMNKDVSKPLLDPSQYRHAENVRITNVDGEGNGALVTVKGNSLAVTIPNVSSAVKIFGIDRKSIPGTFYIGISDSLGNIYQSDFDIANIDNTSNESFAKDLVKKLQNVTALASQGFRFYTANSSTEIEVYNEAGINVSSAYIQNDDPSATSVGSDAVSKSASIQDNDIPVKIIGHTLLREQAIIFTTSVTGNGMGQIWIVSYDTISDSTSIELKFQRRMNFSLEYPIEAVARYETEKIQRVYFTDNNNDVRVVNLAADDPSSVDPELTALQPSVDFSRPTMQDIVIGSLNIGVHQYAYRLKSKSGAITKFSTLSDLIPLASGIESSSSFYTSSESQEVVGKNIGEDSGKGIRLSFKNLDLEYDYIEIAHLYYSQRGVDPIVNIIETANIPKTGELSIIHSGSEEAIASSSAEVLAFTSNFTKAKSLAIKDNTLFVANIESDALLALRVNARAYRYKKNGTIDANYIDDVNADPFSDDTSIKNKNAINPWNEDVNDELDADAHAFDVTGSYLGGTGPIVSYKFVTEDIAYGSSTTGPGQTPASPSKIRVDIQPTTTSFDPGEDTQIETQKSTWKNYKSPHYLSHVKGYQRGEVYRFGLVLFDEKGRPGFVNWIGDIKFPHGLGSPTTFFDDSEFALVHTNPDNIKSLRALGIEFTVDISKLPAEAKAYRIVRLPRRGKDKTILGTGALFNTYNYEVEPGALSTTTTIAPLYVGASFDPDSNPFRSDNDNRFIANGIYPANWGDLTDISITAIGTSDRDDALDGTSFRAGKLQKSNNVKTFDSPDFHFLGDPIRKEGDSLRYIGTAYNIQDNLSVDIYDAKTLEPDPTTVSEIDDKYSLNGLIAYPSTFHGQDIVSGVFNYRNTDNTLHTAAGSGEDKDSADYFDQPSLMVSSPLNSSWVKYFPLYALNIQDTVYTSLDERKLDIWETCSLKEGEDGTINGQEFKNAFVGYSFTHDFVRNAGTRTPIGVNDDSGYFRDNNSSSLKFNYSGIGSKTLVVFMEAFTPSTINYVDLEIAISCFTPDSNTRVSAIAATIGGSINSSTREVTPKVLPTGEVPIMQYVRNLGTDQYGGNTEDERALQDYIPCSALIPVGVSTVKVFGGDTIVGYYNVSKSTRRPDGKGFRVGYTFPVESTVAFDLREGNNFMNQNYPGTKDNNYTPDDYILNSVYLFAMDYGIEKYTTLPINVDEVNRFDTTVYASQTKTDGEFIDSWRKFDVTRSMPVEGHPGPINKLLGFKNEVFFLQDRGFGRLVINPRALTQTSELGELQLGEGNVLDDFQYISTEHGSEQQFSSITSDAAIYFIDTAQHKLFQYTGQGFTSISEGSINTYLQSPTLPNAFLYDNPYVGRGIVSAWDKKYNEVLFTFHNGFDASITGATRADYTFTFSPATTQIKVGEVIEITDGTVTFLTTVKSLTTTTVTVHYIDASVNTSGITINYASKEEIIDTVGGATNAFTNVDTRITSQISVGDYVRVDSSVTGTSYYRVNSVSSETITHSGGYVVGTLTMYGYISKSETLAYGEPVRNFVGYYSCSSNVFFNINNTFYSLNPYSTSQIFVHDTGNYGLFYGGYYDSLIDFLVNTAPQITKSFDNVSFHLESFNSAGVQQGNTIDEVRFHSDYQNTDWVTVTPGTNIRRTEREWQMNVPRNAVINASQDIFDSNNLDTTTTFRDRIRDKYMNVNIKIKNGSSNIKKLLHYVTTFFRQSAR